MFEKVRQMIADQLSLNAEDISISTDIMKDLGADSIDVMEMLMTMEEELGVSVPDDMIQNLKTVGDLVSYMEQNAP